MVWVEYGFLVLVFFFYLWVLLVISLVYIRLGFLCMVVSGVLGIFFLLGLGKFFEWSFSEVGWIVWFFKLFIVVRV